MVDALIGTSLDGKYKIVGLLGEGGMGHVYEATEMASGRRVAAKVIHADRKLSDEIIRRFRRETRAAMAVPSRHLAQVLDAGGDPATGAPYMVMEYLSGEDMEGLLRRTGPLPPELALRIVAQACIGLQRAHEAGIVHRDIKPANLFLAREPQGAVVVKILDFGIAKICMNSGIGADTTGLTHTGSMLGSPLYMSPEQARGIKEIDHRSDIWSLGIVLYRALTGRVPHDEIEAFGDLIMAICSSAPPHVQDFAPWVPPDIAAVAHAALRRRPEDRYQSAADMLRSIQTLLPQGIELREDMLVALTEDDRAVVASRLDSTTIETGPMPQKSAADRTTTDVDAQAETAPALPLVHLARPGRAGWKAPVAIGVLLSLGLVGLGFYSAARPPTEPVASGAELRSTMSLDDAQPGRGDVGARAPSKGELAARVQLKVWPSDAAVEIDGAPARAADGLVEVVGALGTVHRVRLVKGDAEIAENVVVTENGAMPQQIALAAPAPKAPPVRGPVGRSASIRAIPAGTTRKATLEAVAPKTDAGARKPASPPPSEIRESFE